MGDGVPGFCGRKWGPSGPNSPMTTDPNADLFGFSFPTDRGVATVTGTARWNPLYVTVNTPSGPTVRVAAQVRRRRELS